MIVLIHVKDTRRTCRVFIAATGQDCRQRAYQVTLLDLNQQRPKMRVDDLDPIKSLVECGVGDDVTMVIIDGVVRVKNGNIEGLDLGALCDQVQQTAEAAWTTWGRQIPLDAKPKS